MNATGATLYLVRHGKAEPGEDDELRRLTAQGEKSVRRVGRAMAHAGVRIDGIEHSGLVRARETAELLAVEVGGALDSVTDLRPSADVRKTAERLESSRVRHLMLVGHLPSMARLGCYLLTGDADAEIFHFRTSAVACLSRDGGSWMLEWFLTPDLA